MASSKESAPVHEDIGMESRSSSDWELLSMSQVDVSGGHHTSGSTTPDDAGESNLEGASSFQGGVQSRSQLEDSFFSTLGLEGFQRGAAAQSERTLLEGESASQPERPPQQNVSLSGGQLQTDWGSLSHLGWSQAGDSGVLVPPPPEQPQQGLGAILPQGGKWKDSEEGEKIADIVGGSLESGLDKMPGFQREEGLQKKEDEQYADSPVSPLAGPSSFEGGSSYASALRAPPPPQADDRAHLKSWMGVQSEDNAPNNGTETESESDLGYDNEQEENEEAEDELPLAGGVDVASQTLGSVGGVAGSKTEGKEKEPPSALQKWFPYEAWWQKQETLRRWVRKVLSQPLTVWSLGLTTAILGALLLHQLWRNRDLQAQLKAGKQEVCGTGGEPQAPQGDAQLAPA